MRPFLTRARLAVALALSTPLAAQRERPSGIPVDVAVPYAPQPVAAEGQHHLVYEVHVTNFGSAPLVLRRLDVIDAVSGANLATYAGDTLAGVLARPGTSGLAKPRVLGAGLRAVVFVDVRAPVAQPTASRLVHRLTFEPMTPPNGPLQSEVVGGEIAVRRARPAPLGPPLAGDSWLASHGLSNASTHRRTLLAVDGKATIAQRFAVDWTRIGADGQVFRGDPARNENWTPYGEPVLAVADARVIAVKDGIPENDPTKSEKAVPITLTTVGGNYVILDLGDGRYVFYAHLQPRSLAVRVGDKVRRGQVLARLGNSGQSDAPHLHLQVMEAPSPLASEGLPLVFDAFELEGHVPSLTVFTDGTGWRARGKTSRRVEEMPLENAVVRFPERRRGR